MRDAKGFVRDRLRDEYGIEAQDVVALGGRYHPTPGATPEVVHPFAATVHAERAGRRPLVWTPLHALLPHTSELRDGHLRIALLRAAHALSGAMVE